MPEGNSVYLSGGIIQQPLKFFLTSFSFVLVRTLHVDCSNFLFCKCVSFPLFHVNSQFCSVH